MSSMRRSSRKALVLLTSSTSADIFRPLASAALSLLLSSSHSCRATEWASSALREGSAGKFSRDADRVLRQHQREFSNSPGRRISQPLGLALKLANGHLGLGDVGIFLGSELHELLDRSLGWVYRGLKFI